MIKNCQDRILLRKEPKELKDTREQIDLKEVQELWKRDPGELIDTLKNCILLYKEYKQCYQETKDKVESMPKGKSFNFSETQIFGKFDAFVRRYIYI